MGDVYTTTVSASDTMVYRIPEAMSNFGRCSSSGTGRQHASCRTVDIVVSHVAPTNRSVGRRDDFSRRRSGGGVQNAGQSQPGNSSPRRFVIGCGNNARKGSRSAHTRSQQGIVHNIIFKVSYHRIVHSDSGGSRRGPSSFAA
jgi:hypothetical protein